MQNQGILYQAPYLNYGREISKKIYYTTTNILSSFPRDRKIIKSHSQMTKIPHKITTRTFKKQSLQVKSMTSENGDELSDDDDELCPVECVREFKTDDEFLKILEKAKEGDSLVVVDFYRTSCGSCKYIEQGFSKLCRGAGDDNSPVIFLKHNVIDEYDEESEVADRLRIRSVPLFHFYKNGVLLEAFATRDKERILAAILKYTAPASVDVKG